MQGNRAYAFTEPSGYEAGLSEMKVELIVTGGGPFKAALTRAEVGQLTLLRSRENCAGIAYVRLPPDLVFVTFPTRFDPPPVCCGQELRSGDMIFHSLGERLYARTAGPSERGVIALEPDHLAYWSKVLTEEEVVPLNSAQIIRPPRSAASRLLYLHASACGLVEKSPKVIAHPEVARALEQELIHALISCLRPDTPLETRRISVRATAVMNRFEEVLAAHNDRPLHMPDLCMEVGASERTLERCCAKFLGVSPTRYLRLRRLKLVRRALLEPDATTTNVAAVARRHGFTELGRFSGIYRAIYGEAPSATLRMRGHRGRPE